MAEVVIWSGPVYSQQVVGGGLPTGRMGFIPCRGDRGPHPHCPSIGDRMRGSSPQALAREAGVELDPGDELYLAGFSAGGSLIKRLLEEPAWRDEVVGVHLADATYTSQWVDRASRVPPPIEGFVRYAEDVVARGGDKLFVMTASPVPNGQWASGVENLYAIMEEVERRTGRSFVQRSDFFGISPAPEAVYQLGNVIVAPYPMAPLGHGHNALASEVWSKIFYPWQQQGKGLLNGSSQPSTPLPSTPSEPDVIVPEATGSSAWSVGDYVLLAGTTLFALVATMRWMGRRSGRR